MPFPSVSSSPHTQPPPHLRKGRRQQRSTAARSLISCCICMARRYAGRATTSRAATEFLATTAPMERTGTSATCVLAGVGAWTRVECVNARGMCERAGQRPQPQRQQESASCCGTRLGDLRVAVRHPGRWRCGWACG
eukprot:342897-Chlamydomonas_euryale.AAC.3